MNIIDIISFEIMESSRSTVRESLREFIDVVLGAFFEALEDVSEFR